MYTVMNILVIALMWGTFTLYKKRPQIRHAEFQMYLGAIIITAVLVGFYYTFEQFLWAGLAASVGAVFGIAWNRYIEES